MLLESLAAVLVGLSPPTPPEFHVDPAPELPEDWASMVDPMDPLDVSQFMDALFPHLPPHFITDVCLLESGCRKAVGIHTWDTVYRRGPKEGRTIGRDVYARQVEWGKVAEGCPYYKPDGTRTWFHSWSTTGNHGLMYGYNRKYIGECFPPQWFAVPLVSGLAAARKATKGCQKIRASGRRCTAIRLRIWWAHKSKSASREVAQRWRTRLADIKDYWTEIDWAHPPTMADYRQRAHYDDQTS